MTEEGGAKSPFSLPEPVDEGGAKSPFSELEPDCGDSSDDSAVPGLSTPLKIK